jgi:signal peptidase
MALQEQVESMKPRLLTYVGPSMNPYLKPGERIQVIQYDGEEVRRGDVVVFIPPGGKSKIVHRVIYVGSQGIKTQGDNCHQADPWLLSPDCILGRAVCARRLHKWRKVSGGSLGHLYGVTIRAINAIEQRLSSLLHPIYEWTARTGVFKRLLPAQMAARVISYSRSEGRELQLLMGRWVIGRRLPGKSRWNIRRPFRLFVDEESLPGNASKPRM